MSKKKKKKGQGPKRNLMVGFLILAMIAFIASQIPWNKMSSSKNSNNNASRSTSSQNINSNSNNLDKPFNAESTVIIQKQDGSEPIKVDVELALDKEKQRMGLMYRKSLPDHGGMLFVMEKNEIQSFWMKNTYVPLDIIYVDLDKKIVSIAKNTVPLNETSLPSEGIAKYVLEVNAGFSDAYNLQKGDQLNFTIN